MARGNGFVAGQSLPATVPLRNNLFPGQGVTLDGNRSPAEGAVALQRNAWTNIEAEAKAQVAVAKARKANAEASLAEAEREAKAKIAAAEARTADAEARTAEAEARVAEAQAATKIRVAAAEAREADLKILKLGKEIDVFTGVPLDGGDEEQRSGTVLLEDVDFNENKKKKSRTRSSRLPEVKKRRFEVPWQNVALYTDTKHILPPSGELSSQVFFPEDTILLIVGLNAGGRRRQLKVRVTGNWKTREDVPKWAEGMANYERHAPRLFEIEHCASKMMDWVVFEEETINAVQMLRNK